MHVRFFLPFFFFVCVWTLRISVLSGSGFCLFACFVVVKTLCQVLYKCGPLQLCKTHGCHRINFCEGISNTVSSWDLSILPLLDYQLFSSSSMCMKIQDKNTNVDMYLLGLYWCTFSFLLKIYCCAGSWRCTFEEIILIHLVKLT